MHKNSEQKQWTKTVTAYFSYSANSEVYIQNEKNAFKIVAKRFPVCLINASKLCVKIK